MWRRNSLLIFLTLAATLCWGESRAQGAEQKSPSPLRNSAKCASVQGVREGSSVDVDRVKESVDLIGLIGQDTELKPKSSAATEHAGPCPWCGGRDRFVVWPARWWCRQCERQGDATGGACAVLLSRPVFRFPFSEFRLRSFFVPKLRVLVQPLRQPLEPLVERRARELLPQPFSVGPEHPPTGLDGATH